jgi:Fe-S-cluster-containing dehydrogenase component/CRP-like cAMP-binding protein
MKDVPLTWRRFLQILLEGIAPGGGGGQALQLLEAGQPLKPVLAALRTVPGYNLGGIGGLRNLVHDETTLDDDLSQQSPEKRLFFLVEYGRGEVIMEKGTFSDYAALHVQGVVRVWLDPAPLGTRPAKSCWGSTRPAAVPRTRLGRAIHWLFFRHRDKPLPTAPHEAAAAAVGPAAELPGFPASTAVDFSSRLMGLTSVVWKQPRTATLIADNDTDGRPCRMLLIKRILLRECLLFTDRDQTNLSELYLRKVKDFFDQSLPGLLARNRLFRPLFYVEEVKDWGALLNGLADRGSGAETRAQGRVRNELPRKFRKWLGGIAAEALDDAQRYRVVSEMNDLLDRPDLHDPWAWPLPSLGDEERGLLQQPPQVRTAVDIYRLNRLLIEAAFPGVFESVREFCPCSPDDFKEVVRQIRTHSAAVPAPLRPSEGDVFFEEGAAADGLYLILDGRVRLNLGGPGERIPFNHLVENGFFGESCVEEGAEPRALYQAEALTRSNLLKIERPVVRELVKSFPDLKQKLIREKERMRRRAEQVRVGRRLPPAHLPHGTAGRLMRATNLLVIDMDRCTRCDQCVRACTESHQGHPRFHRANPDFRIDRWEVAGACVHCSDAPCLEACPVGAITLLENGSVQVVRDRCITCRKCEPACPFHVIEYHPPVGAADGASAKQDDYVIAHKCDLCLTPDRDPPCVVACPYGAAKRGAPSAFFPGLKSMARFSEPE